ncbi:hypothetical protein RRG08_060957 [Elysia crispata]|uniref:Uncharacterized protein n=1 Tax=Elysia crispata TaxID=231223 RepID=A0AAE1AUQ1_9GAST|nr:hypothetical protein RRG08_060957 [Elysia crispata]
MDSAFDLNRSQAAKHLSLWEDEPNNACRLWRTRSSALLLQTDFDLCGTDLWHRQMSSHLEIVTYDSMWGLLNAPELACHWLAGITWRRIRLDEA